jgi:hypothetical protein
MTMSKKKKMPKTDPLSIRNEKRRPLKSDGQDSNFLCGKDCKFRAKKMEFEPGSSGLKTDQFVAPVDLEGDKSAEERIESGNAMARERQAQDKTKRKTGTSTNPRDDPNQVRVTLTTLKDAQGRITGSSTARSLLIPANLDMNPIKSITNLPIEG